MRKTLLTFVMIVAVALSASATTQATGTTVSPTLTMSGTIVSAVRLTLATGTSAAAGHCAVTSPGPTDYTMSFGNMDALGISAGNCNVIAPTTPGTSPAIYWSDLDLTPIFTGQPGTTGTVTATVQTNFAAATGAAVVTTGNSATVPTLASQFSNMALTPATTTMGTALTNNTKFTRFVGISLTPTNGAGSSGLASATVTFTLTVP